MSKEALAKVIQRSISDAAFRRQLATDPTGALRGYELNSDETAAIRSGDSRRLTALGVEQRMSKAFTLSDGGASVSNTVTSDLGAGTSGALTAGDGAGSTGALISGGGNDQDAMIASGNEASGRTEAWTPDGPAHSTGDVDGGNGPTLDAGFVTGDSATAHEAVLGDDPSGAAMPGEATGGPNIQE